MAKKQLFGDKVLAAKAAKKKMARVILSRKTRKGKVAFQESSIEQSQVKDFISRHTS